MKQRTIMMQTGTFIPESLRVEAEPYWHAWEMIRSADGDLLERDLRKAGWNFFFLAESVEAMVWGHCGAGTVRRAVRRVLAKVKLLKFNCLEITGITQRRFLGLPYVARVGALATYTEEFDHAIAGGTKSSGGRRHLGCGIA